MEDGFDFHAPDDQLKEGIKNNPGTQKGPQCFIMGGILDHITHEPKEPWKDKQDIESDTSLSCGSDEEADYGNLVPRGERRNSEWLLHNQDLPEQGHGMAVRHGSKTKTITLGTNTTISSNGVNRNSFASSKIRRHSRFSEGDNTAAKKISNYHLSETYSPQIYEPEADQKVTCEPEA